MQRVFGLTVNAGTVTYDLKVPIPYNVPGAQEMNEFSPSPPGTTVGTNMFWNGDADSNTQIIISYKFRATTQKWSITPETSGTPGNVPAQYNQYLGKEWKIDPTLPEIKAQASKIAGDKPTVYEKLDAMATWAGVLSPVLDNLRFARLDRVGTDHDLSIEVLAALLNGQQQLLTTYIEEKLRKAEPVEISRGIMVAGFSDQSEFNDEILKKYEASAGLIGSAQKAAKYAYERNVWARHWFEMMCQTDENTDFWCYAVLFLKIVDGRVAVWRSQYPKKGRSIQSFGPAVDGRLKNRFAQWENHRNKKLFGSDAPASIFLEGADDNK